jgi:hypothetical protein
MMLPDPGNGLLQIRTITLAPIDNQAYLHTSLFLKRVNSEESIATFMEVEEVKID